MTTYVEYEEPWGEVAEDGQEPHTIIQTVRLLKEDVVRWQMSMYRVTGQPKYTSAEEALSDFMVVHWARLVEVP